MQQPDREQRTGNAPDSAEDHPEQRLDQFNRARGMEEDRQETPAETAPSKRKRPHRSRRNVALLYARAALALHPIATKPAPDTTLTDTDPTDLNGGSQV